MRPQSRWLHIVIKWLHIVINTKITLLCETFKVIFQQETGPFREEQRKKNCLHFIWLCHYYIRVSYTMEEKERENDINQNTYYSTQEQQSIRITDTQYGCRDVINIHAIHILLYSLSRAGKARKHLVHEYQLEINKLNKRLVIFCQMAKNLIQIINIKSPCSLTNVYFFLKMIFYGGGSW